MIEKRAIRFVAITFILLALYVLYGSLEKLVLAEIPGSTLPGILIATLSLIIMPVLWYRKRELGRRIGSRALIADSEETLACALLSLPLLIGLLANYLFGFWQADPLAGLLIAVFLIREGREWWNETGEGEENEGQ